MNLFSAESASLTFTAEGPMDQRSDLRVRHPSKLKEHERERIFYHGLHEEGVFYNRLNFFLLFESLFFAVTVSALTSDKPLSRAIILLMCSVGLVFSAM